MYLLMLLATFVSAIYGYNLSVRPDYDRDIAVKKAKGIVYRFNFQEDMVTSFLGRIAGGRYQDRALYCVWPNDTTFADTHNEFNEETSLVYARKGDYSTSENQIFHMRKKNSKGEDNGAEFSSDDYLAAGRKFYDGSIMVSRVLCLDKEMQEDDVSTCASAVDDEGHDVELIDDGDIVRSGSCCANNRNRFLVTYRTIDSRWINRIHKGISIDLLKAVVGRAYTDNIGVIHWDETKEQWMFQGKINFGPVYTKEMRAYEAEHRNDENPRTRYYPMAFRERSDWAMPKRVFDRNFFKDYKKSRNICDAGCLFKIRYF